VRYGANGVYVYATHYYGVVDGCRPQSFNNQTPNVASPRCEYAAEPDRMTIAGPSTDNHSTHTVQVDASKIPVGHPGYGDVRTYYHSGQPSVAGEGVGAFRITCRYSHMAFNDPIVYPGQSGRSHLHAFFGNTGVTANSTTDSIANSGNSTCAGGILNRSAYWVPPLIDTRNGAPVQPSGGIWYYKTGYRGVTAQQIQVMPRGLRIIAGNMNARSAAEAPHQAWTCDVTNTTQKTVPLSCPGTTIFMTVVFPQCWDGVNLDSPNHQSHMAYADGGCPSSHPVALPEITLNIYYLLDDLASLPHLRLSSDMYDSSIPAGWSIHADWWDGWDPVAKQRMVNNCSAMPADCGTDHLGDNIGLTSY
jgi:hypothetical protein